MSKKDYETGARVRHKDGRIGLIKRDLSEGKYLVSVRGGRDEEWPASETLQADEPEHKWQDTFSRPRKSA